MHLVLKRLAQRTNGSVDGLRAADQFGVDHRDQRAQVAGLEAELLVGWRQVDRRQQAFEARDGAKRLLEIAEIVVELQGECFAAPSTWTTLTQRTCNGVGGATGPAGGVNTKTGRAGGGSAIRCSIPPTMSFMFDDGN